MLCFLLFLNFWKVVYFFGFLYLKIGLNVDSKYINIINENETFYIMKIDFNADLKCINIINENDLLNVFYEFLFHQV